MFKQQEHIQRIKENQDYIYKQMQDNLKLSRKPFFNTQKHFIKRHSNLSNEIYREDKYTLIDFTYHLFIVAIAVVLTLSIADLIFGAEAVTNLLAEVVMWIK